MLSTILMILAQLLWVATSYCWYRNGLRKGLRQGRQEGFAVGVQASVNRLHQMQQTIPRCNDMNEPANQLAYHLLEAAKDMLDPNVSAELYRHLYQNPQEGKQHEA